MIAPSVSRLDAGLLTVAQIVTQIGSDRAEVEQRLEAIEPAMRRGRKSLYRLVDVWPALASLAGAGNAREALANARAELSKVRQQFKAVALDIESRVCIDEYEVRQAYALAVTDFVRRAESLADVIELELHSMTPEMTEAIHTAVRLARTKGADELRNAPSP